MYIHAYTHIYKKNKVYIYIIEWFGLEGAFKNHLVQTPAMDRDNSH